MPPSEGLVTVKAVKNEHVELNLGREDQVKAGEVPARVRAMMDKATAEQVVQILCRQEGLAPPPNADRVARLLERLLPVRRATKGWPEMPRPSAIETLIARWSQDE